MLDLKEWSREGFACLFGRHKPTASKIHQSTGLIQIEVYGKHCHKIYECGEVTQI